MSIKLFLVDDKSRVDQLTNIVDQEKLITLGTKEDEIVFQLKEILESVIQNIPSSLNEETEVSIEVEGAINFVIEGGVKYLFFNVGTERQEGGKMKVCLTTTIKP